MQTSCHSIFFCHSVSYLCQLVSLIYDMEKLIYIVRELEKLTFNDLTELEEFTDKVVSEEIGSRPPMHISRSMVGVVKGLSISQFVPKLDIHRELKNKGNGSHQIILQNVKILIEKLSFFEGIILLKTLSKMIHIIPGGRQSRFDILVENYEKGK